MRITLALLISLVCLVSQAQKGDEFAARLYEESADAATKRGLENVYLRTSKEVYETGEDLWFYARVLNSQSLTVSDQSQILYVELSQIGAEKPVHREMYGLVNGFVKGHLSVPDSLTTGEYKLTAFTANSLKYDDEPIESARRLVIKKKIIPQVLIQTNFSKPYFTPNEPIEGSIRLFTPAGKPVAEARTILSLKKGNKNLSRNRNRTDSTGRLAFRFEHKEDPIELQLQVRVNDQGIEELFGLAIPYDVMKSVQLQFLPEGGTLVAGLNNKVAFKAVDRSGLPVDIEKATLYADGAPLLDFSSEHAGMGSFNLFVNGNARYTVKVETPRIDSVYVLPKAIKEGVRFFVQKQTAKELRIGVMKTEGFGLKKASLAIKQRGELKFMATAKIKDSGQLFKVPTSELGTGIAELILYSEEEVPLASRLVYVGHDHRLQLNVSHAENNYGVKEEVTLKLQVTDQKGKPVQSALSLALNDEMYASPYAEKTIVSHYFLDSELRGRLYEPAYYFDNPDETKSRHLDLLLLCQGWRSYEWNQQWLQEKAEQEPLALLDFVMGQLDVKTLPGRYKKNPLVPVTLVSGSGAVELLTDSLWRFPIVPGFLASSEGSNIVLTVGSVETARMSFTTAFDNATDLLNQDHHDFGLMKAQVFGRNWNKLPQSMADSKKVMGVTVVDQKDNYGKSFGQEGVYKGNSRDYVCQYNILNCRNHRFGTRPVAGRIYRMGGRWIVYESPEPEVYPNVFKGYYKSPKYYQPEYDTKPKEKLLPDFRNTLVWEPLLFTDENGEATIKLFTSDIRSVFNGWVEGIGVNGHFGFTKFKVNVLK